MMSDKNYNGLSGQRKEILVIIKQLNKATPGDIISKNSNIRNPYQQLDRLLQDGFIKRIDDRTYALTERGEIIFDKKKDVKQKNIDFSSTEVALFEKLAGQDGWLDQLAEQLNPALLGLIKERKACMLSMISSDDQFQDRNRIHLLLCGPSSTGKSKLIEWSHEYLWGYLMGSNARKSGIEGTGKGFQFTPGKLQQADNSTIFIDELDKLPKSEQSTLLMAMEQGKIQIDKDRVSRDTYARIRTIGTCNDKTRIIEPLLSRFDIIIDIKALNKNEYEKLIIKRLNDWNRPKINIDSEFSIKRYLMYAAQYPSRLPNDREDLISFTKNHLRWGQLQNKDIRQIESIPRLLLTIAKLKLIIEPGEPEMKEIIEFL